ncbi:serpin-ZX [Beta vulgaris subsp. vulgaris]|uniref:serpin-ZX n=1 Tax=Beta vulgaris subsp. vulgaris TaxID=3555 RepID=UPI002036B9F8|nr:serpin-ZX [Beta vulgaris subsp. vulgaris]
MDLQQSITDQTDISLSLTGHVSSTEAKDTNLVLSPLSLHVVLSLIASGSSGSTREQILSFLKSKSSDDLNKLCSELVSLVFADGSPVGGPKLSFANGVWVDQTLPLKPTFKQVVDDVYKAVSNQVDFLNKAVEVASEVNTWAEKQTSGLINELLPPGTVDNTTRLIFANAIYFKGAWSEKFDASITKEDNFHLLNGNLVKVPFMTSNKKQFIQAFDGFRVLGLSYIQGGDKRKFSMYFFLPDLKDGLPSLVEKVSSEPGFLNGHLPSKKVEVGNFKLPRFKISFGFEASKVFKGLGVELPFKGGGLTEIVDSPMAKNLYVSSIFQKSFIEVNEEGSEAAAASAVMIALRSLPDREKLDFVADHPFMFVIREDMTGVVLFTGHVFNPLEN